jgi:hypothetical protein
MVQVFVQVFAFQRTLPNESRPAIIGDSTIGVWSSGVVGIMGLEPAYSRAEKVCRNSHGYAKTRANTGSTPLLVILVVVGSSPISHPK